MMQGLIGLGEFFEQAAGGWSPDVLLVPGLFLSPDSPSLVTLSLGAAESSGSRSESMRCC